MSTVEGSLAVQFDDETYPAIEGTRIRLPLNRELLPTGRPDLPEAYEANRLARLPVNNLPRRIRLAEPLERIQELRERIQDGLAPCGVEGLPSCERILPILRNAANLASAERWGQGFEVGVNCIELPDIVVEAIDLPSLIGERQDLPFCPPTERENRRVSTRAIANNALPFDGDEDADGVLNADDACPLGAGVAEFQGCSREPVDSDEDGVVDALDYCPYNTGDASTRGCPQAPRDSDEDGFPNALDVCPNNAGVAEFRGCPRDPRDFIAENMPDVNFDCADASDPETVCPTDIDGDGVPNSEDTCPVRPGLPDNNGCPETRFRRCIRSTRYR